MISNFQTTKAMMKIDVEQEVSNTEITNKVVWDAAVKAPCSY